MSPSSTDSRSPYGATWTLQGTRVEGTIKVESGAVLRAFGIRASLNVRATATGYGDAHVARALAAESE